MKELCERSRAATRALALLPREKKDAWLARVADALERSHAKILEANARDVARAIGLSSALVDRLKLDEKRIDAIARGVREIASQSDPVGEVIADYARPNGLRVRRVRVPLGVIGMIYEARPNVTIEAAALCIKAGNAVILRGGTDAAETNDVFLSILQDALDAEGMPRASAQGLPDRSRESIKTLVEQEGLVDLVIPRGGEALVRFVTQHARVPVVQHYKGVCHLFVDEGFDIELAKKIIFDAKLSRPGVCNALECLLLHARVPPDSILESLRERGCEIRTGEDSYGVEFLDRVLAVRTVTGIDEAIAHVSKYGSGHTEAILTNDPKNAERWKREIDAACVVVNASTRFHDGGELGLGAEIGIATSRLHWRGPMGLESLTTMKWMVEGGGQTRG